MNLRESTLTRIVQLMKDPQQGLVIKDRTFHFHVFPDCFVGNEFVTWTLHNGIVDTREHATMLGQDLLDRGILFHTSNDQPFKDGYFFYTLQKFPEISDSELDILVIRMKAHPTGVSIQDRSHHLRNYRDCFVGKEAVDWFVNNVPKYTPNRQVAVKLGQELMNKGIVHSPNQQAFSDNSDFYFFQKPVYAGYLGKLTKTGTDWKLRWFAIKEVREKKLWYFNSPRDPVPRDFISLADACVRVVLDQEVAFMEICTPMRIFTLRATSTTLLARWVRVLSDFIGEEGFDNNLRIESAEKSICAHESRASTKTMRERQLVAVGPSVGEGVQGSSFLEGGSLLPEQPPLPPLPLNTQRPLPVETDSTRSSASSRHNSQLYEIGAPIDPLPTSPLDMDTLDLMNDEDLADLWDEFVPSENGKPPDDLETKYEGGLVGEANCVPSLVEETEEEQGGMSNEQLVTISRLKEQLISTSSQDRDYIPVASLSLLPPIQSEELFPPPPKAKYTIQTEWIDNPHLVFTLHTILEKKEREILGYVLWMVSHRNSGSAPRYKDTPFT